MSNCLLCRNYDYENVMPCGMSHCISSYNDAVYSSKCGFMQEVTCLDFDSVGGCV